MMVEEWIYSYDSLGQVTKLWKGTGQQKAKETNAAYRAKQGWKNSTQPNNI